MDSIHQTCLGPIKILEVSVNELWVYIDRNFPYIDCT